MQKDNKPTILFITHYHGMYGANQSLCKLIIELKEKYDINPIVLVPSFGEICNVLAQNNIKYNVSHYYWWVNENDGIFQKLLNIRKQFRNLFRVSELVSLLKNENIALVYSNSITINIGYFLSKKLHCQHIWHIRESLEHFRFKFSLGVLFSQKFLKKGADKYIVISDFIQKSYINLLPPEKTVRIYNGVSIDFENKRISNVYDKNINLCCLGVLCEQKNQLYILKAIKILKENGCENIILHLIGNAKKNYLEELEQYITHHSLECNVIIHGHKSNINELLSTMNLGIMPSNGEAFGRVTIEYMLHKIPIIASESGANTEIISDGFNGFLFKLNDEKELANKIAYYMNQPSELERMGNIAFDYAKTNFSSKKNTQAIHQIIQELLENSNN